MPTMRETGERIRRLRIISGLGQVEFAQRIGIANGSVSKLENGRMAISDRLLNSIARVLDCSPSFLLSPIQTVPTTRPWLRAYADASKRAVDQQIADSVTATEVIEMLGLKVIPDTVPTFHGDLSDDSEIEQFALDVRAATQLSEGDVVGNAMRAAERLGCLVLPMREELGRHLGLSTRANLTPVISVSRPTLSPNSRVPGDRQRFTVAHELGHLALHGSLGPPQTAEEAGRVETQAHLFAGAFLAPGDAMLEELSEHGGRVTLQTLTRIKERWGISIKALVRRFQNLGVIDVAQARSLYKQISARGWNREEPVVVGNEQAVWFTKAIEKRATNRETSVQEAAAAAGIGQSHLKRWTDWSATRGESLSAEIITIDVRPGPSETRDRDQSGSVSELPIQRL